MDKKNNTIDDEIWEEDEYLLDIPKEQRYLNSKSYDYSIDYINSLMIREQPKIILEVPFQRNRVWKNDRASQLIESIILNVPIPPLYFAEEENGEWLVIDGLQRLNAIKDFFNDKYALRKLDIIKELEGLTYSKLPAKAKSLLEDGMFRINVIKYDSHPDIKYDIFMRLNRGAVSLNYQELRNCLYRGNLNDMLKEIPKENEYFLRCLNLKQPHNRYLDSEFIIRFFALNDNLMVNSEGEYEIKDYKGRMVSFINNYMDKNADISLQKKNEMKEEFNSLLKKVETVFNNTSPFSDPTTDKISLNKSIADIILLSFNRVDFELLTIRSKDIIKLLVGEIKENEEFRNSLSLKTSDRTVLNYRVNYWIKRVEMMLNV